MNEELELQPGTTPHPVHGILVSYRDLLDKQLNELNTNKIKLQNGLETVTKHLIRLQGQRELLDRLEQDIAEAQPGKAPTTTTQP